jgi:hypothetical protein
MAMTRRFPTRWIPALALFALAAACDSPTEIAPFTVQSATIPAAGDAIQLVVSGAEGALPSWESLDTTIVRVTPAGMAVGVSAGTATVRARLGSRTEEGAVTVLPPVDVRLTDVQIVTDDEGQTGLSMQVTNLGGRGYYRIEMWKAAGEDETEHRRISWSSNDNEAGPGMSYGVTYWDLSDTPDWVLVYAREPLVLQFDMTACVRLDGGSPCPMP